MFSCFRVPLADSRSRVTQHTAHITPTVHYKFKSQKDYDSVVFDGMFLSVGDLKRSIVDKKGLARDQACELLLTNAQNDEELVDDAAMVWKNTSVIVRRVPSLRAAAVGSEVGSTTQKKTVYVRPPEPLPNAPRLVRRVYPPTHTGAMRWSADGTAQHATPSGNGGEAPDGSIAALVNDAANAWETEKAAAAVARRRRRAGRRQDRVRPEWRKRRRQRRRPGRPERTASPWIHLFQVQRTRALDPPVPHERRPARGRDSHENRVRDSAGTRRFVSQIQTQRTALV